MNVSAELIKSLETMLTSEQFKAFKYAVRLENNPQAAILDKWNDTPGMWRFFECLAEAEDECGFVTNDDVEAVLNNNPGLLYACRVQINGDFADVVGPKDELEKFCKCRKTRRDVERLTSEYCCYLSDIVRNLTQTLTAMGLLNRTEYIKDYHGGTRRCYKIRG